MKAKKYIPLILMCFLVLSGTANAQFTLNKKYLKEIDLSTDTIFISQNSFNEKEIQRYKKQDILDIIEKRIKNENTVLRQEIATDWKDKQIHFLDESEIEKRIKDRIPTLYISAQIHNDRYFDKRVGRQRRYYYFQHYDVSLNFNRKTLVSVALTNEQLTKLDLHFALSLVDYCLNNSNDFHSMGRFTKEVNLKSKIVQNEILLVSKNTTAYSEDYLKSVYGENLQMLHPDSILTKIHNHTENTVYLIQSLTHTMRNPMFNHFLVQVSNDKPVLLYRNSMAFVKPCSHTCIIHKENEKLEYLLAVHFKQFKKIINKSI